MQHERHYTEIRIANEHGVYAIRVQRTEMTLQEMWDSLIRPAISALEYPDDAIDKLMLR